MNLTRDEWMTIDCALLDRVEALARSLGGLCFEQIKECWRLHEIVSDHIEALRIKPKVA